jgi:hypothetical protein
MQLPGMTIVYRFALNDLNVTEALRFARRGQWIYIIRAYLDNPESI